MSSRIVVENINRIASKAPLLTIAASDPVNTATAVPVNKTITLTFSMPLHPPTVTNGNITLSPGDPARVTTLDPVNHKIVTIDPTSNLAAATLYTVTATTGLKGLYGPWTLTKSADSITFTTV